MMAEEKEWSTPQMREFPFWKRGMTEEEFEKEREYFYGHIEDWKNGTYKPLWKQAE